MSDQKSSFQHCYTRIIRNNDRLAPKYFFIASCTIGYSTKSLTVRIVFASCIAGLASRNTTNGLVKRLMEPTPNDSIWHVFCQIYIVSNLHQLKGLFVRFVLQCYFHMHTLHQRPLTYMSLWNANTFLSCIQSHEANLCSSMNFFMSFIPHNCNNQLMLPHSNRLCHPNSAAELRLRHYKLCT